MTSVLSLSHAGKAILGKPVLDDVTLSLLSGAKLGVVGPGGTGKSTLLRLMAGQELPTYGDIRLQPGIRVGLLEQDPALNLGLDVLGAIEDCVAGTRALLDRFNWTAGKLASDDTPELLRALGHLRAELDRRRGWDLENQIEQVMRALNCPQPGVPVRELSRGERCRVALCGLLLSLPDLLLLDEPTAHMDAGSVTWLGQHLSRYPGTVVAVTHDQYLLDNVLSWILELDRCRARSFACMGGAS